MKMANALVATGIVVTLIPACASPAPRATSAVAPSDQLAVTIYVHGIT